MLKKLTTTIFVIAFGFIPIQLIAGPTFTISSLSNFYENTSTVSEATAIVWTSSNVDCDGNYVDEIVVRLGYSMWNWSTTVSEKAGAFLNYTMLMNAAEKGFTLEIIDTGTYWSYSSSTSQCVLNLGGNQGNEPTSLPIRINYQ